jgi:hypothetical protein
VSKPNPEQEKAPEGAFGVTWSSSWLEPLAPKRQTPGTGLTRSPAALVGASMTHCCSPPVIPLDPRSDCRTFHVRCSSGYTAVR